MEKDKLDKIINFIREQATGAPTMSVGDVGYTSKGGGVTGFGAGKA